MDSASGRRAAILVTWPFLASLALLLANDWWLKAAHPGWVTGKLSDFSGIAVVALLVFAASPARWKLTGLALGLCFLWWKSPASQAAIDWAVASGLPVGRTVDYTDLLALAVLPGCRRVASCPDRYALRGPALRRLVRLPVAALSVVAIMGTTLVTHRDEYSIRRSDASELPRRTVFEALQAAATERDMKCVECGRPLEGGVFKGNGITVRYAFVGPSAISFHAEAYATGLIFGLSAQENARRAREEIREALARRFRGLEFVEPLEPRRIVDEPCEPPRDRNRFEPHPRWTSACPVREPGRS